MSEQRSFMQQLDEWTETTVINPLTDAAFDPDGDVLTKRAARIKEAIRQKVLESYHNGQAAGPARQPRTGYQPRRQFSKDH